MKYFILFTLLATLLASSVLVAADLLQDAKNLHTAAEQTFQRASSNVTNAKQALQLAETKREKAHNETVKLEAELAIYDNFKHENKSALDAEAQKVDPLKATYDQAKQATINAKQALDTAQAEVNRTKTDLATAKGASPPDQALISQLTDKLNNTARPARDALKKPHTDAVSAETAARASYEAAEIIRHDAEVLYDKTVQTYNDTEKLYKKAETDEAKAEEDLIKAQEADAEATQLLKESEDKFKALNNSLVGFLVHGPSVTNTHAGAAAPMVRKAATAASNLLAKANISINDTSRRYSLFIPLDASGRSLIPAANLTPDISSCHIAKNFIEFPNNTGTVMMEAALVGAANNTNVTHLAVGQQLMLAVNYTKDPTTGKITLHYGDRNATISLSYLTNDVATYVLETPFDMHELGHVAHEQEVAKKLAQAQQSGGVAQTSTTGSNGTSSATTIYGSNAVTALMTIVPASMLVLVFGL